jgi:hypothetical protein
MVIFLATVALLLTFVVGVIAAEQLGAFEIEVPPDFEADRAPARPRADARILFCQPHGSSLTVDCIDQRGVPVALHLRSPETRMFSDVTTSIMCDWANDERIVAVELSADGRHITLDDGATCLHLELAATDLAA